MIGLVLGSIAGYSGGGVDAVVMRFVDLMLVFPSFFLLLAVLAFLPPSLVTIMVVIGATSWMRVARLVRVEFLSLKEREFVLWSHAIGAGSFRIVWRHILPNAMAPIIVLAFVAGQFIFWFGQSNLDKMLAMTGGMLLGQKISDRVAEMRTLPAGIDQRSACRHPDWTGPDDLRIKIEELREATAWEKPIYVKLGATRVFNDVKLAVAAGADVVVVDGMEGGTGATQDVFIEHAGIPTLPAVRLAAEALREIGMEDDVQLVVSGGIRTGADVAKALALGATAVSLGVAPLILFGSFPIILNRLEHRARSRFLGEALAATRLGAVEASALTVVLEEPNAVFAQGLQAQAGTVEEVLRRVTGQSLRLRVTEAGPDAGEPAKPRSITEAGLKADRLRSLRAKDPALDTAVDALDLEIVD